MIDYKILRDFVKQPESIQGHSRDLLSLTFSRRWLPQHACALSFKWSIDLSSWIAIGQMNHLQFRFSMKNHWKLFSFH